MAINIQELLKNSPQTILMLTTADLAEFALSVANMAIEEAMSASQRKEGEEIYMTSREAKAMFHLSAVSLWRWTRAGLLHPRKAGRRNLFLKSEIEAAIEL